MNIYGKPHRSTAVHVEDYKPVNVACEAPDLHTAEEGESWPPDEVIFSLPREVVVLVLSTLPLC